MGWQGLQPELSLVTMPGQILTCIPRRSTPMRIKLPMRLPLSLSTSMPGLFMLKEQIMISHGSEVKL